MRSQLLPCIGVIFIVPVGLIIARQNFIFVIFLFASQSYGLLRFER